MANNASSGRFYAFTTNTSAPLPPSATPPDPRYRRDSSGSDSVSNDDSRAAAHSYPVERAPQGQGVFRESFGDQNVSGFVQNRVDPASATIYVDDPPYVPTGQFRTPQPPSFIPAAPDVPFTPAFHNFGPAMPPPMTPSTPQGAPHGHYSGDSSPVGSNGSGGSGGSGHMSGSSQESASTGVVGYESPVGDPTYHDQDPYAQPQRVQRASTYNPEHYPAYDEHRRRIGMDQARFGIDTHQPGYAYYRPRTHAYPPVGAYGMAPGMGSPEEVQSSNFPSPELQMSPMQSEEFPYDRDARGDHVIPGQTRIQLPASSAPRHYDNPSASNSLPFLLSGDDAVYHANEEEIRRHLGLNPGSPLSLYALPDPPPGQRPGHSIPILSQLAILGSPNRRLTLQEIFHALQDRFEWFRVNRHDKSWQNSIRHNLSLYKCFRRMSKPITEPGKGSYWVVDYSEGAGTKRPRKRNKRVKKEDSQNQDNEESDPDMMNSDDSFQSPASLVQDIPLDPQLQAQSHQVGQARSRLPPASVARSIARRGNSPYSQNVQVGGHARHVRQSVHAARMTHGSVPGYRQASNIYNEQPAFGEPSMAPPGYAQSSFGYPGMPSRSATAPWPAGPGQPMHSQPPQFLPPPNAHAMGPTLPPPQPMYPRGVPTRAHTLPANIASGLRSSQYNMSPTRLGYEPARDASGRFVSRSVAQQRAPGGPSQEFVQGSSRGERRVSSSSGSSRE